MCLLLVTVSTALPAPKPIPEDDLKTDASLGYGYVLGYGVPTYYSLGLGSSYYWGKSIIITHLISEY